MVALDGMMGAPSVAAMSRSQVVHPISAAGQAFLDDATEILSLAGSSAEQFRRYVREHLAWCEANGLQPPLAPADRARYRQDLERRGVAISDRQWRLRATYLNKLPMVVAEIGRCEAVRSKGHRTRRIDALPAQSPLARAIEAILGTTAGGYRNSLRADIAVVLEWCDENGVDPTSFGLTDLAAFDHWLRADGRRSRGPHFMAKRLHSQFMTPEVWWR